MRTLGEATDYLLRCDDPAEELVLADQYIRQYNQDPDRFILPRQRAHLEPFIAAYAHSVEKWLRFVRAVRDEFAAQEGLHGYKYRQMQQFSAHWRFGTCSKNAGNGSVRPSPGWRTNTPDSPPTRRSYGVSALSSCG